ncbi:MAG TPA: sigma-70 family RNA polymerase sigma factor [Candidatus Krumholzibacteria bacterium]|nr:sigma-70 family RNA polymerase sigma factor [Candidatus Krumholzibacteria bacterium]HPD73218.1 sigma-70 family RNA polymerase sigma factor [Candidatus Krumholzibacteria bacterium]HRY40180.1 sigma-70 family RNA polymerase sigma factor [Candidatus Krumholzibacteria bacterium]
MRSRWLAARWSAPDHDSGDQERPADRDLVLAFQRDPQGPAGRAAVARLLERYRRRVLWWCLGVVRDQETARDLAQDVLVSAYRKLPEYRDQSQFGAWLFMIARNRCLSELRRRRVPLADEAVLEFLVDAGPRPDEVLERKLLGQALEDLVRSTLTTVEQDALWLRCYEGLPVETITRRLDIQEATGARAVLQRARRKLRAALDGGKGDSR